ncbi:MAG: YgiT-type zinc finger protein [SAR202 cluster bacterium]|nr:YgiT-type zinc finger protein [SAR202 cluster bacterium]
MKCIVCHGDDIQVTEVNEEVRLDNNVVWVQIKTPVCRTCGERYYDRRTVHLLEKITRELKAGKLALKEVGKVLTYKP